MQYGKIVHGIFLDRPNRFIAHVQICGNTETVHVKNTGRCRELLLPGSTVILEDCRDNPARRTGFDLIAVYKEGLGLVNIDSQAPNALMKEWLSSQPETFPGITLLRPETTYGDSRFDFYLEQGDRKSFIEVKGCTLETDGIGYFPDAPTERGSKHLRELKKAVSEGYRAYLAFVITMPKVTEVLPNLATDPAFGKALAEAKAAGVTVLCLPCAVGEDTLSITDCRIE